MPINTEEVDEVWLALEQARSFLLREGFKPNPNMLNSQGNYSLYLLENAMKIYTQRHNNNAVTKLRIALHTYHNPDEDIDLCWRCRSVLET